MFGTEIYLREFHPAFEWAAVVKLRLSQIAHP
jgi:hypothetical protein